MSIKFNAWDKFEKKMILWNELCVDDQLLADIILNSTRYIPLQFTGVISKQNCDIFQGDIIDGMIVTYAGNMQECLGMDAGWYLQRDDFESYTTLVCDDYYTIQGNIYEGLKMSL